MAACLLALGANMGDRADTLGRALAEICRLPQTQLVARSAWHETTPIGGPAGQGPFLNAAALIATFLSAEALLGELQRIETRLGRIRSEPWDARTLDLDVLLYDDLVQRSPALILPHPRMAYRRFVLEPAVQIAPWMVHPESGWTLAALLDLLNTGANQIAVAAHDAERADWLVELLSQNLPSSGAKAAIIRWQRNNLDSLAASARPKLLLALSPTGDDPSAWRKMLHLPKFGPVAWLPAADREAATREALAAIRCVWPARLIR